MYPFLVRTTLFALVFTIGFSVSPFLSIAQTACSSPTIAAAACSGGNGPATSGVNINSGNTYWFSGGPGTFSSLNLSGGTLRICGNLTITSMTINSGTLIIERGGILNISGSFNVSNLTIINRGTLTITGSMVLQGTSSMIWNDLTTSYLTITGSLTINNASAIVNRGIIAINGSLTLQGTGNVVCLQNNAIFSVSTLANNVANSFTYAGNGAKACLSVSGSASLNNALTASSNITVCKSSSSSSTGWGSATVLNGCSSCATVLSLTITDLKATRQSGNIMLQWTTSGAIQYGDLFYVERSTDGSHFYPFTSIEAKDGQFSYTVSDDAITAAEQYYRIRTVTLAGNTVYSIIVVTTTLSGGQTPFIVYPNPVHPNGTLNIALTDAGGITHLSLTDAVGRIVRKKIFPLINGSNLLRWDLQGLRPGIYFIRIARSGNSDLYSAVTVLDGY